MSDEEEGYDASNHPTWGMEPDEDHEMEDYAVGIVPCPHCDENMILGIYDPDGKFEDEEVQFITLAHEGMQDHLEGKRE